jgi:hypothetical protein
MSATSAHNWLWSAGPAGRPARSLAARSVARVRRRAHEGVVLEAHERVLGDSRLRNGGSAVATDRALVIMAADGRSSRYTWADIAGAEWAADEVATVVSLWPENGRPPRVVLLTDRSFAALASERVAAAQVMRRRVRLTETVVATIVATRTPDSDEVIWRVWLDAGHDDPQLAQAAQRVVTELRRLAGC